MKTHRIINAIRVHLQRRKYPKTWFTWVLYETGQGWRTAGDPFPTFSPTNAEIAAAIAGTEKWYAENEEPSYV